MQLIHINATPQWLATQWERNKRPLAKTNGQQNISPTAIALSQAHHSGRKYGGNCTPKDFNELEATKNRYCKKEHKCKSSLSKLELQDRTSNAQQCAIARTTINNKCFAGGDSGHREAATNAWIAYTTCREILSKAR